MPTSSPPVDRSQVGTKYRTYKRATDRLAGWLATTARGLGCGKGGNDSNALKVDQFIALTDVIIKAEPKVEVPIEIVGLAETAFHYRLERSKLLKGVDLESDKRHQYIISIIAEVVEKLRNHVQAFKKTSKPKTAAKDNEEDGLAPSFQVLDLDPLGSSESEDDNERLAQAPMNKKSRKKKTQKKNKKVKEHMKKLHLSEDEDEDPYFVLMCLLSDLKSIREYLKEVWHEYKAGKVDLITASLITNSAFDVIKTYLEDFPAMSSLLSNYSKTVEMIMLRNVDKSSMDQLMLVFSMTMPCGTEVDDIMERGRALSKMQDVAELTLASALYFLAGPRDMFFHRLGDRILVENEYDSYGKYRPEQDRSKLDAGRKFREDIQILNYFAHGFYDVTELHHGSGTTLDQLTIDWEARPDLDVEQDSHTISLAEALSAQIILDIHHILRQDVWHGFRQLYEMGKTIESNITQWKKDTFNNQFKAKYRYKERAILLDNTFDMVQGLLQHIIRKYESSVAVATKRRLSHSDILHSSYMALNPVLCGTLLFHAVTIIRDSGSMTAAFWKSIQSAGQLYYSCKMLREFAEEKDASESTAFVKNDAHLDTKTPLYWDDMEYLFEIYGKEAFFHGHLPHSNEEVVKHVGSQDDYTSALGLSQIGARVKLDEGLKEFMKLNMANFGSERGIGSHEPVIVSQNLHYCKYSVLAVSPNGRPLTGVAYWKLETLQALLENQLAKEVEQLRINKLTGKAKKAAVRSTLKGADGNVSQVSILRTLKETLQSESRVLHFDFLSFHLNCLLLLRTIRRQGQTTFENLNGGVISGQASYAGDEDFPDKMRDIVRIVHQPEALPLQGPRSVNKGHVVVDTTIREFLESDKNKDRQIKKIASIWGIAPS